MENILKKFFIRIFCAVFFLTTVLSCTSCGNSSVSGGKINVVTSFYPVYLAALNITDGVSDVNLINLTPYATGCLHDYQLTSADLKTVEKADIFIANGLNMENFLDKVTESRPELNTIYAGENIATIDENPHVWVSIGNYIKYVENIAQGLIKYDPANMSKYSENLEIYKEELLDLKQEMEENLKNLSSRDIIVFHEAFPYFAEEFNLNILASIEREPDEAPSARELADTIDIINESGCRAVFAEPGYSQPAIDVIARETGAKVYILDPVSSNIYDKKDAYITAMRQNMTTLMEALK